RAAATVHGQRRPPETPVCAAPRPDARSRPGTPPARPRACARLRAGVPERQAFALVETPVVRVYDVVCRARRSPYGSVEVGAVAQLVLPRRGVFVVERGGQPLAVDTTTALVLGAGEEYRVSHPGVGGDDCTVMVLPPDLLEEAVGGVDGRAGSLRPRDHLATCLFTRALR